MLQAAVEEELAEGHGDVGPKELAHMSKVCKIFRLYAYGIIQILIEWAALVLHALCIE